MCCPHAQRPFSVPSDPCLCREKLREVPSDSGPPYVFGNPRYNISFDQKPDVEITEEGETIIEPFGTKYTFYLQDAVDHVPEYLVPWQQFEKWVQRVRPFGLPVKCADRRSLTSLAKEYDLELAHFSTFSDLFYHEREVPEFAHLMKNMRVVNMQGESDMDIDEVCFANLCDDDDGSPLNP